MHNRKWEWAKVEWAKVEWAKVEWAKVEWAGPSRQEKIKGSPPGHVPTCVTAARLSLHGPQQPTSPGMQSTATSASQKHKSNIMQDS